MWHVDEGGLHAWLDGALDAYPREDAERIRAHLDSCGECRARLEEARAVRREAEAVLAGAEVVLPEPPPLEELRARARAREDRGGAGGPSGPLTRMRRLSWAASVVVALGAGWLARDLTVDRTRPQLLPPAPAEILLEREAAAPAGEEGVAASPMPEAGTGIDAGIDAGTGGETGGEVPADTGGEVPAAPAPVTEAREMEVADRRLDTLDAPAIVQTRPMDPAPEASPLADAGRKMAGEAMARASGSLAAQGASATLGHPAFPVAAVSWIREVGEGSGIRLLQLLPGGGTLEVIHLRSPADPSGLPPAAEGYLERVEPRDGGWMVLRGPVSADSLRVLARGVPGGVP